ncbi:hypothetical protein Tco_1327594 [Tanacetum coccineum]
MAQLKYCDKHNQVGFLRKPDESAGFAEIVDFLRGSNLMYALTTNPTIYDSLVKQFWQTATAKTLADGTLELHATIDTIVGFRGVPRPLLHAMLSIPNPSAGQEAPSVTQPQPSSSVVPPTPPSTQPIPSEATTILPFSQPAPPTPIAETTNASPSPTPSPAHEPMEHTFEQPSTDQQPPTPSQEATTSQLMARIADLEKQLKETKQTFGKAILTLVERVKSLEVALKRKTKRVLLSDSEEEETEAQGRKTHDLDPLVSLVQDLVTPLKTPSKTVNASQEEQVEDISPTTLEAAAILTKVKKINAGIEEINAGSLDVNTSSDPVTTDSIRVSVPSPDREEAGLAEAISFDDESTQKPTEKGFKEDKDDKPTKRLKRRKQIARKGLHTDLDKDDSEDLDEASEKDDSTSSTNASFVRYGKHGHHWIRT